jgi:hypothetical protein
LIGSEKDRKAGMARSSSTRRERDRSLSHRRLGRAAVGDYERCV